MEISELQLEWRQVPREIFCTADGAVQFADDYDHFQNGLCRLLELDQELVRGIIEETVKQCFAMYGRLPHMLTPDQKLDAFKSSFRTTFPLATKLDRDLSQPVSCGMDLQGNPADTIFASSISGNNDYFVAGCRKTAFAWLVDARSNVPVLAQAVQYDQSYFEGGRGSHYGMPGYIEHRQWRLEKARRLVNLIVNKSGERGQDYLANPDLTNVLDVGSAVGYFRQAFSELGFQHYGIDLSRQAIAVAKSRFGFDTFEGSVFDLPRFVPEDMKFDIISLWDVIEHFNHPDKVIAFLRKYLSVQGIIVIRTPNLLSMEAEILGDYYYSFKLDHLVYFSAASLGTMMDKEGFYPVYFETSSHLLKGLVGTEYLSKLAGDLKGADIVAVYAPEP